jgi:hypothetical protein
MLRCFKRRLGVRSAFCLIRSSHVPDETLAMRKDIVEIACLLFSDIIPSEDLTQWRHQ